MRCASSIRDSREYSRVSERKMGLPPIGLTIGKRALRKRKIVLAA
jgi:hypothetical protein